MVIRQTQQRVSAKRSHQCTRLRQLQRSISQTGTPLAFNQQRCEVRIQPPHPSVMRQINPRSLNGSYEYHDAKYDQWNWSNHPKRLTHPRSKLEMELGNLRQQQSQKRTTSGMPFWILHSSNCQLGSCRTKQLPKFLHPHNQDQLQVRISVRPSQRWNCPPNLHTTPRWRNGYREFLEHIWRSTVPLWEGHQIWDDLQFSKWIDS